MSDSTKHPDAQDPETWQHDLNPDAQAGQNTGLASSQAEKEAPTAFDLKETHQQLAQFTNDELKQILILPAGTRLQQGATYIDLHAHPPTEFKALGSMEAGAYTWYVPKSEVDYQLWNRLIGVETPERLGESTEHEH